MCIKTSYIAVWLKETRIANVRHGALVVDHYTTHPIQVMRYDYVCPCDPQENATSI